MKHWILWLVDDVVSLLGGTMALTNPLAVSLTAERLQRRQSLQSKEASPATLRGMARAHVLRLKLRTP